MDVSADQLDTKPCAILTVSSVDLEVVKGDPGQLSISAIGVATTPGWTNPGLEPRVYYRLRADRMMEFDFVADPPTGPVLQVPQRVDASYIYDGDVSGWRGVRVFAETNVIEVKLADHIDNPLVDPGK